MSRMFLQALEGLKGSCGATLGLKHISVTKKGNRAGMHDSIVRKMLKKSIDLKVLSSDANTGETGGEDVRQVIATRGEKKSDLGCCYAGSAWTLVTDPALSLAPVQTLACSESPNKTKSWQHRLLC